MSLIDLLRSALRSVAANKLRAALTMLGVVIGVASVIAMLALGNGARAAGAGGRDRPAGPGAGPAPRGSRGRGVAEPEPARSARREPARRVKSRKRGRFCRASGVWCTIPRERVT